MNNIDKELEKQADYQRQVDNFIYVRTIRRETME